MCGVKGCDCRRCMGVTVGVNRCQCGGEWVSVWG